MADELTTILSSLAQQPDQSFSLAQIALLIAKDEYAWLNVDTYLKRLQFWGDAIRPHFKGLSLSEKIATLSEWIFNDLTFEGNQKDYYNPSNSYLNDVIEKRTGIPITLSVVMMAIGERAGLYSEGIGLPGHFILRFVDEEEAILVDAFAQGKILTIQDCLKLVENSVGYSPPLSPELVQPTATASIVTRMLNNLRSIYESKGDFIRAVRLLSRMRQLQPADRYLRKSWAICLTQVGQPTEALSALHDYLHEHPEDKAELLPWVKLAEREKSRLN